MKSELILGLISSHCSGSEDSFKKALQNLADDEENKGNLSLAQSIRSVYAGARHGNGTTYQASNTTSLRRPLAEMTKAASELYTPQRVSIPKDRDSSLELVEVLEPKVTLS
jgi:hypothetical protein